MLKIHPLQVFFPEDESQQDVQFENCTLFDLTFKIEANCSTRYKVLPITGLIPAKSMETIVITLRKDELARPHEDRFLIRVARFGGGNQDFNSAREFWLEMKKSPDFTFEKFILPVVDVPPVITTATMKTTPSPTTMTKTNVAGEDSIDLELEEMIHYAQELELSQQFALAAAWLEHAVATKPAMVSPSIHLALKRNLAQCLDFDLQLAREEVVTKTQTIPSHSSTTTYKTFSQRMQDDLEVVPSHPQPPPPPPFQPKRHTPTSSSTHGYLAPTEASLAHRRRVQTPQSTSSSALSKPISPPVPTTTTTTEKKKRVLTPVVVVKTKYILDVTSMHATTTSASSTRIILPNAEITVREMKDLILSALHCSKEFEDVDLFVNKDLILADHWRGVDFGLLPGLTRLHMKRKPRRAPVKRIELTNTTTTPATGIIPPPPLLTWEAKYKALHTHVENLEAEKSLLLNQLNEMGKEYDALAGRLLEVSQERDELLVERMHLNQRVFLMENSPKSAPPPHLVEEGKNSTAVGCRRVFLVTSVRDDDDNDHLVAPAAFRQGTFNGLVDLSSSALFAKIDFSYVTAGDQTVVVVGDFSSRKTTLMEGSLDALGLYELVATRLFQDNDEILLSGFQTFRNGEVIDFLGEQSTPLVLTSLAEFERKFPKLLRRKRVGHDDEASSNTQADSCVVITFELVKTGHKMRVIESTGDDAQDGGALVGRIVLGEVVTVFCVLHALFDSLAHSCQICNRSWTRAQSV